MRRVVRRQATPKGHMSQNTQTAVTQTNNQNTDNTGLTIAMIAEEIKDTGFRSTLSNGDPFFPPHRVTGSNTTRPQREDEWIAVVEDYILDRLGITDWRAETPTFLAELNSTAREIFDHQNESENDPKLLAAKEKLKPSFLAQKRKKVHRAAELAAIRRTAYATNVREQLKIVLGRGRPLDRSFITAMFEYQAYGWARPEIRGSRTDLLMPNLALDYVFEDARISPGAKDESSIYQTFAHMLERHDPDLLIEQNILAVKELRSLNDRVGVRCAIDATKIAGPFQQGRCRSGSRLDEVLSRGQEVGQIDHDKDEITRGWYMLVIADIDSGVPIIWRTFAGTKAVQQGSIDLVHELYRRWGENGDECPLEVLVGDKEFSLGKEFSRDLVFGFGVHPVFPLRANHGKGQPHRTNLGVPYCKRHDRKMSWKQLAKFFDPKKRRAEKLAPGVWCPTDTHMVWFCPECQAELEEQWKPGRKRTEFTRTYVKNHPLLYTTMPMGGDSRAAYERKALERYRGRVESLFSAFKRRGNGHAGVGKCMWSETKREAEWLNGGTLLGITLSQLVHKNGDYERESAHMSAEGLI